MVYKILFILLSFILLTKHSLRQHQQSIKFGEYNAVYKDSVFTIAIRSDSTFTYTKQVKWPVEFTYGKWRTDKNKLLLLTVPDTLTFRSPHYSGRFVFFENQEYIINGELIIKKNNPAMKYTFNGKAAVKQDRERDDITCQKKS